MRKVQVIYFSTSTTRNIEGGKKSKERKQVAQEAGDWLALCLSHHGGVIVGFWHCRRRRRRRRRKEGQPTLFWLVQTWAWRQSLWLAGPWGRSSRRWWRSRLRGASLQRWKHKERLNVYIVKLWTFRITLKYMTTWYYAMLKALNTHLCQIHIFSLI